MNRKQLSSCASWSRDVIGKATPGRGGSGEPWLNSGPEENEKDTTLPTITLESKYFIYVRSPAPSHKQTLSNPFRTLAIKWEVNIFLRSFPASLSLRASFIIESVIHCVGIYPVYKYMYISAWTCICVYKHIYYVSI